MTECECSISDFYDWPQPTCQFPDWLRGVTWRDVTGRWQYVIRDHGNVIYGYFRPTRHDRRQLRSKYRCIRTLDFYELEQEFIFLSFSTHEWYVSQPFLEGKRACYVKRKTLIP